MNGGAGYPVLGGPGQPQQAPYDARQALPSQGQPGGSSYMAYSRPAASSEPSAADFYRQAAN